MEPNVLTMRLFAIAGRTGSNAAGLNCVLGLSATVRDLGAMLAAVIAHRDVRRVFRRPGYMFQEVSRAPSIRQEAYDLLRQVQLPKSLPAL
jgi:hypothetical protein